MSFLVPLSFHSINLPTSLEDSLPISSGFSSHWRPQGLRHVSCCCMCSQDSPWINSFVYCHLFPNNFSLLRSTPMSTAQFTISPPPPPPVAQVWVKRKLLTFSLFLSYKQGCHVTHAIWLASLSLTHWGVTVVLLLSHATEWVKNLDTVWPPKSKLRVFSLSSWTEICQVRCWLPSFQSIHWGVGDVLVSSILIT